MRPEPDLRCPLNAGTPSSRAVHAESNVLTETTVSSTAEEAVDSTGLVAKACSEGRGGPWPSGRKFYDCQRV